MSLQAGVPAESVIVAAKDATSWFRLGNALQRRRKWAAALKAYDRATALRPDYPAAFNNRGAACLALDEAQAALADFDRALALAPGFAEALYNRANALRALKRFAPALSGYDAALAARPDWPEALNNRGNALRELQRPADALASYERALALRADYAEALENKAVVLIEFGEIDLARQILTALVAAEPQRADAHFHLGRVQPMRRGDPRLAALERLDALPALGDKPRIRVKFALGKAYDDIGDADAAFRSFAEGNALRRARRAYDESATLRRLQDFAAAFSRQAIAERRDRSLVGAAPIFIVGMPRSGSTLVEQILARHPAIAVLGEVDAFPQAAEGARDRDGRPPQGAQGLARLPQSALEAIAARYLALVGGDRAGGRRTVDKLPSNFAFAGLIHLALPNARIIHTRRDALDTCWSCFTQCFSEDGGFRSGCDLGELGRYYRAQAELMAHWRAALPGRALLTVDYEDLVADIGGQTRRLLDHCGLAWNADCLDFHKERRQVRSASAGQVHRPLYASAIGRASRYARFLQPLIDGLGGVGGAA